MGAIDFTYSNGHHSSPLSLHSTALAESNQYVRCINAVASQLQTYCSSSNQQKYTFFGFGAVPEFMGMTEVSHCFPLNGNRDDPSVEGIDNLV